MGFSRDYDWDKTRERFEAWWHQGVVDRPLLLVFAPKKDAPNDPPPTFSSLEERWLDPEFRIRQTEWRTAHTYHAGDAFPYVDPHIGPGTFSLYLGSKPKFMPETVWYGPCIDDIPNAKPPVFDESNKYWQISLEMARRGLEHFGGEMLVAFPDLIENLDTVASLIGSENLLFALLEQPEKIHELQRAILPLYLEHHRRLYEIIKDEHGGSCFSCFNVYGKGRISKLQCDFSAMISKDMFAEFVAPYLAEQCRGLDKTVYHWDGPGALQHEEHLLAIKELNAIQWTPGDGREPIGDKRWWPMYKRVLDAGKSLMLCSLTGAQARALVEEFGPEGLYLDVKASCEEEADELVRESYTWKKR